MEKVKYRVAQSTDIPSLVELINLAYRGEEARRGWTHEADLLDGQRVDATMLKEMLETPGAVVLSVAGDVPDACVYLQRKDDKAYLGTLTVRPGRQGNGLGGKLLSAAEEWVREVWHVSVIEMLVIESRAELIAWYERRGYRRTGAREPFPYGNERYGLPRRSDLAFAQLEKRL